LVLFLLTFVVIFTYLMLEDDVCPLTPSTIATTTTLQSLNIGICVIPDGDTDAVYHPNKTDTNNAFYTFEECNSICVDLNCTYTQYDTLSLRCFIYYDRDCILMGGVRYASIITTIMYTNETELRHETVPYAYAGGRCVIDTLQTLVYTNQILPLGWSVLTSTFAQCRTECSYVSNCSYVQFKTDNRQCFYSSSNTCNIVNEDDSGSLWMVFAKEDIIVGY
jgi:hypothetical protein